MNAVDEITPEMRNLLATIARYENCFLSPKLRRIAAKLERCGYLNCPRGRYLYQITDAGMSILND